MSIATVTPRAFQLGAGIPAPVLPPPEPEPDKLDLLVQAVSELRGTLLSLPAPEVTVREPDLSAIVQAVVGLKPSLTADEIGRAVRDALRIDPPASSVEDGPSVASALEKLGNLVEILDNRMIGLSSIGAPGPLTVGSDPNRQLGHVTVDNFPAASDARTLTERMFAKAPQVGYSLYLDTADTTYIYLAEAPVGGTTNAQGVRVTKDASGNPLGAVATATGFDWNARGAASWAS